MNSRDLFQLAVRLLGLVFMYHGVMSLAGFCGVIYATIQAQSIFLLIQGLVVAGLPLAAGYWCVCGAGPLMQVAYPEPAKD